MTPRVYQIPEERPTVLTRGRGRWLIAPHWPFDAKKLEAARQELRRRGHCLIRAVWSEDEEKEWFAVEGSHRIWLCAEYQVPVEIQAVPFTYRLQHDNPDLGIVTAAEILAVGENIRGPEARYTMRRV